MNQIGESGESCDLIFGEDAEIYAGDTAIIDVDWWSIQECTELSLHVRSDLTYTLLFNITGKRKYRTHLFAWVATKLLRLLTGLSLRIDVNWQKGESE